MAQVESQTKPVLCAPRFERGNRRNFAQIVQVLKNVAKMHKLKRNTSWAFVTCLNWE